MAKMTRCAAATSAEWSESVCIVCMTHRHFEKLHYNSVNSAIFCYAGAFVLHSISLSTTIIYFVPKKRRKNELLNNKWMLCTFSPSAMSYVLVFRIEERENCNFPEYFYSELFVKYHEFNIMGQVSDLWCMLKCSTYVQFFIFTECVCVCVFDVMCLWLPN